MEGKDGSSKAANTTQLSSTFTGWRKALGAAEGSLVRSKGGRLEVWDWMRGITEALCLEGVGEQ